MWCLRLYVCVCVCVCALCVCVCVCVCVAATERVDDADYWYDPELEEVLELMS